jgi:hypothetical protein
MKFAEIRGKLALVLLAAICLLAVPALSRPADDNPGGFCQGPMFAMKDNLTSEELDNMTLGQRMKEGCAMSGSCKMNKMGPMGAWFGRDGEGCKGSENMCTFRQDNNSSQCCRASQIMPKISPVLLMNDLIVEDLENMTLNEIKALAQEKTLELDNMTLSEVRQLVQTRLSERDNMTLFDLKEETRNMRQMSRIIEWVSSKHHFRA